MLLRWMECDMTYVMETYALKLRRPPASAIFQTLPTPPTWMVPWMTTASCPATMINIWTLSAHSTAFIPPCSSRRHSYRRTRGNQPSRSLSLSRSLYPTTYILSLFALPLSLLSTNLETLSYISSLSSR